MAGLKIAAGSKAAGLCLGSAAMRCTVLEWGQAVGFLFCESLWHLALNRAITQPSRAAKTRLICATILVAQQNAPYLRD